MKNNLLILLGVVSVIGVVILVHYLNLPPTLTVTNWDMSNPLSPAATYTFGIGTGNTGTGGTCDGGGGWTITSSGNILNIYKNGNLYRSVTLTGVGVVPI